MSSVENESDVECSETEEGDYGGNRSCWLFSYHRNINKPPSIIQIIIIPVMILRMKPCIRRNLIQSTLSSSVSL